MSASNNPTLHPIVFRAKAKFEAKVDLPTPPFALEIAIVNLVPFNWIFLWQFSTHFSSHCVT